MLPPLGPIGPFTYESRQALFAAALEAAENHHSDDLPRYVAAAFVRSPSIAPFVQQSHVDLPALLKDLGSAAVEPHTMQPDGFTGIRMPETLVTFFKQLEENLANSPEQSVTPPQVLLLLLEFDAGIRDVFSKHGFDLQKFRKTVESEPH